MKHSTPDKAKFKKLQRRLGLGLKETVGLLEMLWRATIVNTIDGAIGRLDDETIAIECDYHEGEPEHLVESLVECGWLDRCEVNRLVIHDWKEHAPTFVKGNLRSHKKDFAMPTGSPLIATCSEQPAKQPAKQLAKQPTESTVVPSVTKSNQTKPPPPPSQTKPAASVAVAVLENDWPAVAEALVLRKVTAVSKTLAAAKANGCEPESILATIEFWDSKRPAFDEGALAFRIQNSFPGSSPADGWPRPKPSSAVPSRPKKVPTFETFFIGFIKHHGVDPSPEVEAKARASYEHQFKHRLPP